MLDAEVVIVPENDQGQLTGEALRSALVRRMTCSPWSPRPARRMRASSTTWPVSPTSVSGLASGCTSTGRTEVRHSQPRVCARSSTGSSVPTASSSTHTSGCSQPTTAAPCCTGNPNLRARHTHSTRGISMPLTARSGIPGIYGVHLTRRARGLPFWFSLATHGTNRYTAAIEQTLATARAVAEGIRGIPQLSLLLEPTLSVVLFERPGWDDVAYRRWSRRLALEGRILCIPTLWKGRTALRLAFVNPATEADHVLDVLAETTVADGSYLLPAVTYVHFVALCVAGAAAGPSGAGVPIVIQAARADQLAGDPGRTHSLAGVVADHDFVAGDRLAEMQSRSGTRHPAGGHRSVMRRVDVHPYRDPLWLRVHERAQRGEGLSKYAGGAAMP